MGIMSFGGLVLILSVSQFLGCGGYMYQGSVGAEAASTTDDVTYLDQYGTWIDVEPFGSVWQPGVTSDWRPFEYGHWSWTDAGWAWVSYEPYGWLVYHYGGWDYTPDVGWFWIRGTDWSAAPVEWLNYDGYCSWAPLPPVGVEWQEPWDEGGFHFWTAVRDRDFDRNNIGHYAISRPPHPRESGGRDINREPFGIHDFERISGRTVAPSELRRSPAPVYMNPGNRNQESRKPEFQSGTHPIENRDQRAVPHEIRPMTNESVQLNRMVLTKHDEAAVRKYGSQVERRVMVRRSDNRPQASKESGHRR